MDRIRKNGLGRNPTHQLLHRQRTAKVVVSELKDWPRGDHEMKRLVDEMKRRVVMELPARGNRKLHLRPEQQPQEEDGWVLVDEEAWRTVV